MIKCGLIKKLSAILTIFGLLIFSGSMLGCSGSAFSTGGPSTVKPFDPGNIKTTIYKTVDNKTYKFLNVQSSLPAPQAYYLFTDDKLSQELNSLGFSAQELKDDVQEKILPNLANGYYDFAYLPLSTLSEYWASLEPKKGSPVYAIIAAAYDGGTALMTAPDIFELGNLAGKTVGIINQAYDLENALNNLLSQSKLKTKAAGGTVDVRRDSAQEILNALLRQEIAAIICGTEYKTTLQAMGFQDSRLWKEQGLNNPNMVLVVRSDILEKHPDVVTAVLGAHVRATLKAKQDPNFKIGVVSQLNQYRISLERKQKPLDELSYDAINIDYNPNRSYVVNLLSYIQQNNYLKSELDCDKLINVGLLNKVLKKQGLEQID